MDVVGSPIRDEPTFPLAFGNEVSTSRMSASFHKSYPPPMRVFTYIALRLLVRHTIFNVFLRTSNVLQNYQCDFFLIPTEDLSVLR